MSDNATAPYEAKCAALRPLMEATKADCIELRTRYALVQRRLTSIRRENEYLIAQLSRYPPSDFESDQSELEGDDTDLWDAFPSAVATTSRAKRSSVSMPKKDRSNEDAIKPAVRKRSSAESSRKKSQVSAGGKRAKLPGNSHQKQKD
ncbi:hypothetical protein PINS_up018391 [Pythium insidiosum]|nr:hypothetical protein PINS_up013741 [Pythium insidiosum]GLE07760.1 hypothetical protein PINS_up018391 [Pythium insidiosum]